MIVWENGQKKIIEGASGSTRTSINIGPFSSIRLLLPESKSEQHKIAEILTTVDDAIEQTEALIRKYQRIKQGLMQDLLTRGVDENGKVRSFTKNRFIITKLGLIPENWTISSIGKLFSLGRGRVISEEYIKQNPGPYPVYSSQSMNGGTLGFISTYDFDGEYITWTTDGAYAGTVFFRSGKFNCTNVCGTLKMNKPEYSVKFFSYLIATYTKKYVSYVGNPKLMNNIVDKIEIAYPVDPEEQNKIRSYIEFIEEVLFTEINYCHKLKKIKQGLMQDLLTGKVRVNALLEQ